jgi:hypothetical protein
MNDEIVSSAARCDRRRSGRHCWCHNGAGSSASDGSDWTGDSKAGDAAHGASTDGFLGRCAAHRGGRQSDDNDKREHFHRQHFLLSRKYPRQFLTVGESSDLEVPWGVLFEPIWPNVLFG